MLLRAAEQGLFVPVWSQRVLQELASSLSERRPDLGASRIDRLVAELGRAFPNATIEGYESLIPTMRNQEQDRHVLAAAVFARTNALVTWNPRDFPLDTCAPYGITVQTPDAFLCSLCEGNQARLTEILLQQARDTLHPPLSLEDLMNRLRSRVPNFADLAAELMLGR